MFPLHCEIRCKLEPRSLLINDSKRLKPIDIDTRAPAPPPVHRERGEDPGERDPEDQQERAEHVHSNKQDLKKTDESN